MYNDDNNNYYNSNNYNDGNYNNYYNDDNTNPYTNTTYDNFYNDSSTGKADIDKEHLTNLLDAFLEEAVSLDNSTDKSYKQKEKSKIDTTPITDYLKNFDMTTLAAEKPYCLTGPTEPVKFKWYSKKLFLTIAIIIFIGFNTISFIQRGFNSKYFMFASMYALFADISIAIFFNNVIEHKAKLKSGFYNETVNAVCVEIGVSIDSSSGTNSYGHRRTTTSYMYRPILYTRCNNGHSYILFRNIWLSYKPYPGEIYKLNVNSSNPQYFEPSVTNRSMRSQIMGSLVFTAVVFALYFITFFLVR